MFNPTLGQGSMPVEAAIPDPTCYDFFACDTYNGYWGKGDINDPATRSSFWQSSYYGMDHHRALAKQQNKPVFMPEVGSGDRGVHGLANDGAFWDWLAGQIRAMRSEGTKMHGITFWDVSPGDGDFQWSAGKQPIVRAKIRQYIGDGTFIGDPLPDSI
jgi:hypothetical protein